MLQHLERLAKVEGYLRTTRFKLVYARSNAQSRALKGLPATDEPLPEPPTWLALHEFSTDKLDMARLKDATDSEWSERIYKNLKVADIPIYNIAKAHGKEDWFHGVEL